MTEFLFGPDRVEFTFGRTHRIETPDAAHERTPEHRQLTHSIRTPSEYLNSPSM